MSLVRIPAKSFPEIGARPQVHLRRIFGLAKTLVLAAKTNQRRQTSKVAEITAPAIAVAVAEVEAAAAEQVAEVVAAQGALEVVEHRRWEALAAETVVNLTSGVNPAITAAPGDTLRYTLRLRTILALTNFRMSPWGAVAVLFMILFSRWNDNSKLRRVMDEAPVRQTIEQNLLGWLRARSLLNNDSIKHQKDTVFPIILIAAEGGGIRALNWTALILQRAGTIYPDFMNHVYAISGVSGGGVLRDGAAQAKLEIIGVRPEDNQIDRHDRTLYQPVAEPRT